MLNHQPLLMTTTSNASPPICRYLRGKNGHGTTEGGENAWFMFDRVTTVFSCLRTMGPVGPDDYYVDAGVCRSGRNCFTAPPSQEKG